MKLKLFGIKSVDNELSFQLEKNMKAFDLIGKVAHKAIGSSAGAFCAYWENGIPEENFYGSSEEEGTFLGMVVTKDRVHVIIFGVGEEKKAALREMIHKRCEMVDAESPV